MCFLFFTGNYAASEWYDCTRSACYWGMMLNSQGIEVFLQDMLLAVQKFPAQPTRPQYIPARLGPQQAAPAQASHREQYIFDPSILVCPPAKPAVNHNPSPVVSKVFARWNQFESLHTTDSKPVEKPRARVVSGTPAAVITRPMPEGPVTAPRPRSWPSSDSSSLLSDSFNLSGIFDVWDQR